jgi:hypothetical protein
VQPEWPGPRRPAVPRDVGVEARGGHGARDRWRGRRRRWVDGRIDIG